MSPFLVHTLGDTKYGIWSIVSALTGYMTLLDLGVSSAIAKYVAKFKALKDYRSINVVIGSGLAIMALVSLFLVVISPLIANFVVSTFKIDQDLQDTVHTLIIIMSFDIAVFIGASVLVGAFLGFQRNEITNAIALFAAVFRSILFYFVLSAGYSLLAMGVISLIGNIIAAIMLYITMRKVQPTVEISPKHATRSRVASIFNYGKFTFLTMVGLQLIYYSDAFVIGYFLSAAAITIYTIPWALSDYSNKLIQAVAQTFVPVFSEQNATHDASLYSTYISGTKAVLLFSNLLCIGVLALGDYFIGIWMGPKYAVECATLLTIMFATQLIKSPQLLSYSMLLGTSNHQKFSMYNMMSAVANLILSILLVQKFGLIGVATATAITQILFYAVITPIMTSRVINFSLIDYFQATYLRIIPASVILYAILFYFAKYHPPTGYLTLLGAGIIGAIVYMIVAYFTLLDTSERSYVNLGVGKIFARLTKQAI